MKTTRLATIAVGLGMAMAAQGQGIIDSFESWQFVEVPTQEGASVWTSDATPEALGGERDLRVDRAGGLMDSLFGDVALTVANAVTLSCGPGVIGSCHLTYDGVDSSDAINYLGLGGFDLTEGAAYNAISFAVTSDLGATMNITVYQDATHYSVASVDIPADSSFTFVDVVVGMSEFQAAGPDGGADFTAVGALEFEIGDGPPGSDISVQIIGTVYDPQFDPPPPPAPDPHVYTFCQKTQGYWKNHSEVWPVDSLTLGAKTYTQSQLLWLLGQPTRGNASVILAHQLIAAKLNVAADSDPTAIASASAEADVLLANFPGYLPLNVPCNSPLRQQMIDVAAALDAYNNSCKDDGGTPNPPPAPPPSGGCDKGGSKGNCDKGSSDKGGCDKGSADKGSSGKSGGCGR